MTITSSLLAVVLTFAASFQAAAPAQPPTQGPAAPLALEIGLRLMRGDKQMLSAMTSNGDTVTGFVWTDSNFCSAGTGNSGSSGVEPLRWRVGARILERTGNAVVVEAEWQRVDAGGTPDGATSKRQFTIAPGTSALLDEVSPASASPCLATAARLEASVVSPDQQGARFGGAGGARGGGYGAGGMGAGGGRGRGVSGSGTVGAGSGSGGVGAGASGSGAGAGSGFGGAGGGVGNVARSGGGGAGAGGIGAIAGGGGRGSAGPMSAAGLARMMGNASSGQMSINNSGTAAASGGVSTSRDTRVKLLPMPGASYDADVWLVHTPPAGSEETQKLSVHVTTEGQVLTFPQTVVPTERGPVNVDVAVMLSPRLTESGTQVLQVVVARGVTGSSNSLGGSAKIIALPSPADIVSFEMPQLGTHDVTVPIPDHQFSVRIRLTPGKVRFDS